MASIWASSNGVWNVSTYPERGIGVLQLLEEVHVVVALIQIVGVEQDHSATFPSARVLAKYQGRSSHWPRVAEKVVRVVALHVPHMAPLPAEPRTQAGVVAAPQRIRLVMAVAAVAEHRRGTAMKIPPTTAGDVDAVATNLGRERCGGRVVQAVDAGRQDHVVLQRQPGHVTQRPRREQFAASLSNFTITSYGSILRRGSRARSMRRFIARLMPMFSGSRNGTGRQSSHRAIPDRPVRGAVIQDEVVVGTAGVVAQRLEAVLRVRQPVAGRGQHGDGPHAVAFASWRRCERFNPNGATSAGASSRSNAGRQYRSYTLSAS
jgi:hypothetical protein